MSSAKEFQVHGKVHGVGFRISTQEKAQELGLIGWVKNLPDKTVSVFAQGESEALDALSEWLDHGPQYARVDMVQGNDAPADEQLSEFSIRY